MFEQGVSTTTFDKLKARERVDAIAKVVARAENPQAFFYSSSREGLPDWNDHVDAMWAELASGVPTINGYSGVGPPEWSFLYQAAITNEKDERTVRRRLLDWIRLRKLKAERVVWVHEGRRLSLDPSTGLDLTVDEELTSP